MIRRPETTEEWLAKYEELRFKAFDNYQSSGDPRYDRLIEKYDKICDGLRALIEKEDDRDRELERRMKNKNVAIDGMTFKAEYTREEVIEMLNNAVWW